ncbi:MAG: trehalose-6-phosphate synthase, partial [Polyangia bacterium]
MRNAIRFMAPLLVVLGLLSWGASVVVDRTSRVWFQKDVRLRADLAVSGARQGLVRHWREGDTDGIRGILTEITHDERIMAAVACAPDLTTITGTDGYPAAFSCEALGPHVRDLETSPAADWHIFDEVPRLRGGSVHVSAIPVLDGNEPLGFVALVQDMSYADRRESMTRLFTFAAFGLFALAAALITLLVARASWRSWTAEVRRLLRGDDGRGGRPEFQPLLRDVRELAASLSVEHESGPESGGGWTPERLKQTLRRHLDDEKVVVVANREPYIHERQPDGGIKVVHPASGLVTALEPVMRACSGVWVAHGSGSADRDTVDRKDHIWVPPPSIKTIASGAVGGGSYQLRRVWLSPAEEKGYYYGFSNEGLWPLCHVAHARPVFRASDWADYQRVNRKFADAACAEVDRDDPIIFVQDYHFALAPRMIRERMPRATILTFWHIPWPNVERVRICPWYRELLDGLLGSSIVGFHTQYHCNNFLETVERLLEARVDREQFGVVQGRRTTVVRPYPISIDWPNRWVTQSPPVDECKRGVFAELGLAPNALLGVGVDRLDYTKGVEERLDAVERLLERFPQLRGRFTFVQLAAPSRTAIERYRELNVNVEKIVERINARYGQGDYRPAILLRGHHEPET